MFIILNLYTVIWKIYNYSLFVKAGNVSYNIMYFFKNKTKISLHILHKFITFYDVKYYCERLRASYN